MLTYLLIYLFLIVIWDALDESNSNINLKISNLCLGIPTNVILVVPPPGPFFFRVHALLW